MLLATTVLNLVEWRNHLWDKADVSLQMQKAQGE